VDDHAPFLEVAHELLRATPGFESAGEASSAEEGLAAIDAEHPDLVLLDINMPDMSGIEAARRIKRSANGPVVVLITAQDPAQLPAAVRSCGAAQVIGKQQLGPAALRELWEAHGKAA
jgi:DNA-binding NarL/FixJ family response regulator